MRCAQRSGMVAARAAQLAITGVALALGACATADNSNAQPTFDGPVADAARDAIPDAPVDAPPQDAAADAAVPVDGGPGGSCANPNDLTAAASAAGGTLIAGDTTGGVNHVTTPDTCTLYGTDGEDDIYRVALVVGDRLAVTLQPTSNWDASVQLLNACADVDCVIGRDNGFGGAAESFTHNVTTAGTYYIVVDSYIAGVVGPYTLSVAITQP